MSRDLSVQFGNRGFSYFCLVAKPDLCVGVSSGTQFAFEGLALQLKSYRRNRDIGLENRKLRWELLPQSEYEGGNGSSILQIQAKDSDSIPLCANPNPGDSLVNLFNCSSSAQLWRFTGEGRLAATVQGQELCLLAFNCDHYFTNYFCRPSQHIATNFQDQVIAGSFLGLTRCYVDGDGGSYHSASTFFRNTNCTSLCAPEMQEDVVCQAQCDNPICNFDSGSCANRTAAPTPESILDLSGRSSPGDDGGGNEIFYWLAFFLTLFLLWWGLRRKRQRSSPRVEQGVREENLMPIFPSTVTVLTDRFSTSQAIALNQLRYHSKPAGEPLHQQQQQHASSPSPDKFRFEEIGLV